MFDHKKSPIRMNKVSIIVLAFVMISLLLAGCGSAPTPKVYHVGILSGLDSFAPIGDGFIAKMTELGYVEGENITYDFQKTNADTVGEQQAVEKFVTDKVDLIVAFPLGAVQTAKEGTGGTNIPVVFANSAVEGTGLIESLQQPGGNITGVRSLGPDLVVKRFEFLLELMPHLKRLWITYNTNYPANKGALNALQPAVSSKDITLVEVPVTSLDEIKADLEARAASDDIGMDAILIMPDDLSQSPDGWALITDFAAKHNVPIVGSALAQAKTGAVFTYNTSFADIGGLAAQQADKIFKGVPAGTIPVLSPEPQLWLNFALAQQLGLAVPEGMMKLASQIIK